MSAEQKVEIVTYGLTSLGQHPKGLDAIVDCRMIQNPAHFASDAPGTARVRDWVSQSQAYPGILGSALGQTLYALQKNKGSARVGVHCAWGVHRSRVVADALQSALEGLGVKVVQDNL